MTSQNRIFVAHDFISKNQLSKSCADFFHSFIYEMIMIGIV